MEIANSRQEAINKGLLRFYYDKPCKRNHIGIWSIRKTTKGYYQINCRECVSITQGTWRNTTEAGKISRTKRDLDRKIKGEKVNYELKKIAQKKYQDKIDQKRTIDPIFDLEYRRKKNSKGMARYTQKMKAMPVWVDKKELEQIYLNCPTGFEVDHIVPLRGKSVSGLHVPWNLQYLTKTENIKKSNKLLLEEAA